LTSTEKKKETSVLKKKQKGTTARDPYLQPYQTPYIAALRFVIVFFLIHNLIFDFAFIKLN
jgi:hypothetical protein